MRFPAMPRDRERIADHLTNDSPILLQGWKEGIGSPNYQAQRLRVVDSGFEGTCFVSGVIGMVLMRNDP